MLDRAHHLQTLGLKPSATAQQIKRAYHDLVKVWHPDRFAHDPALAQTAQEKLKEINEAHEALQRMPASSYKAQEPFSGYPTRHDVHRRGLFHDSFGWFLVLIICSLILFGLGWSVFHGAFYNAHSSKNLQEIV